jgi:hypothetical protein
VQVGAEAAPRAEPGDGLDGPGDAVAAKQQPGPPAEVPCLHLLPIGERDDRPGREVEPGFDDAIIAKRDPQARVRAEQAPLPERDDLGAATGQGAHDPG